MAKILIAPVSTGLSADAAAKAFAAALNAQIFQAVDPAAETLLAQGKSDDWFDALVGKVAALNADNLVIEGITPDADKLFLAGKNVELALSLDAGVVLALKSDNTDAAAIAQQLNLAKQLYTNSPGLLEGFIIDGAAAALGAQVAEQTGLTFFGSSDKLQDVSALAKREAKRLSPAQFRYNLIDFAQKANMRIVLPEGAEPRTVAAAAICHEKGIARCVLLATREEVEAVVLAIDVEKERISLGIKQLEGDPFGNFISVNDKGSLVKGSVKSVDAKGAVVALSEEVEGYLPASEFAADRVEDLTTKLKEGDEVEAVIVTVDRKNRSIRLSVKAKDAKENREALNSVNAAATANAGTTSLGDLLKAKLSGDQE